MTNWNQRCFVLVSEAEGLPLLHGWFKTEWEAETARKHAEETLPEELRAGLRITPGNLQFAF
ncbi:hypothetical protein [Cupriavidus campinensis]|uniref:Uncharacterized protein n=1 Tax=Cupriavidus campinensis TaxID=151783 RepID=A0ABY3ET71_9BURK|nr:hypothetical protein [Cupriavidus campinensis]TSP13976.1 hypothetical protein FGG12_05760 [Cupriavidus campinensis]